MCWDTSHTNKTGEDEANPICQYVISSLLNNTLDGSPDSRRQSSSGITAHEVYVSAALKQEFSPTLLVHLPLCPGPAVCEHNLDVHSIVLVCRFCIALFISLPEQPPDAEQEGADHIGAADGMWFLSPKRHVSAQTRTV